jgi:hypothetical protein
MERPRIQCEVALYEASSTKRMKSHYNTGIWRTEGQLADIFTKLFPKESSKIFHKHQSTATEASSIEIMLQYLSSLIRSRNSLWVLSF